MNFVILFHVILVITCGFALVKGGAPERFAAVLFGLATLTTSLIPERLWTSFQSLDQPLLAVDIVMLGSLAVLTAKADRFWPMWIAALQLVSVTVHLAKAYSPTILPVVYFAASSRIAYLMLALLVIGTVRHIDRRRRFGADTDWSN